MSLGHLRLMAHLCDGQALTEVHSLDVLDRITLGSLRSNTLWVPSSVLGHEEVLGQRRGQHFVLYIKPEWAGRLRRGAETISLETLQGMGLIHPRRNGLITLPLENGNEIELSLPPFTLRLSAKWIDPSLRISTQRYSTLASIKAIPWTYVACLGVSALVHLGLYALLATLPIGVEQTLEGVAKDFQRIQMVSVEQAKANLRQQDLRQRRDLQASREKLPETIQLSGQKPPPKPARNFQDVATKGFASGSFSSLASAGSALAGSFAAPKSSGSGFAALAGSLPSPNSSAFGSLGASLEGQPKSALRKQSTSSQLTATLRGPEMTSITKDTQRSSGSVDSRVLYDFLSARSGQLQDCYEQALESNPSLRGKAVVDVSIAPDGKPTHVGIQSSDLKDASLTACLRRRILAWTFPRPQGGQVKVSFPLIFTSSSRG